MHCESNSKTSSCRIFVGRVFPGISGTVDPQDEQRIEGHKLGFVGVLARLERTTPDQQWRLNIEEFVGHGQATLSQS